MILYKDALFPIFKIISVFGFTDAIAKYSGCLIFEKL